MVAKAPIAADSVGVAQPADIDATTMTKIDTSGTTYCTNGRKRLPAVVALERRGRRELGLELDAHHDVGDEGHATGSGPGRTPPISSLEIEMPDRLPSSTVSAEGGISMSTAPIAITGPVAMVG